MGATMTPEEENWVGDEEEDVEHPAAFTSAIVKTTDQMTSLTLDSMKMIYDRLPYPKLTRMSLLLPIQEKLNASINQQIEMLQVPVYRTEFLPRAITKSLPLRSQYKTRGGFKMARNYRRWWNRDQERRINVAWIIKGDLSRYLDSSA